MSSDKHQRSDQKTQGYSATPEIEEFREAIQSAGLIPPEVIVADGKLRRFASNGKRGDDAGWYVLHGNGIPAGSFGDWRTGIKQSWRADSGRLLTAAEEATHRAKIQAMRREREADETLRKAEAASKAAAIWEAAQPAPHNHPYLKKKGIKAHGARLHNGALVIPMRDGGELHCLQFIGPDGEKRFITGGRVAGCYFIIGTVNGSQRLCIAEGYATGATIHEATGYPVAVAFTAGNLEPVAQALHQKFPELRLIICADHDARTAGNPGITKATQAARSVGGLVAIPDFGADRPEGATDFNDMAALLGAEAVAGAISNAKVVYEDSGIVREHLTPKSLCGNELGVTCSRDEEELSPRDCAPVPFPEAAWSGLFGHWRDVVAPCTEASLEFLWSSFLVNVGLMLGRTVWIESPQPLYPNFYVLLLGQTGDARKSTALWLARQLLKRLDDDIEIITGIVSTEGLFERLAKHDGTRALGYVDEFRSLLSVGRRQGTRDLLPKLNSLIYCPDSETIDRRKDPTTVVRPFFSLIAATAQDYVADLITDLELSGGMLNRFLMVAGDEQPPKAIVQQPTEQEWAGIAARLKQVLDRRDEPRRVEWSHEAKELWTEFYVSWRTVRKAWDIKSQSLTARIQEHIQKIAVVYSTLAGETTISAPTLATAITIGEWLEKTILRLFQDVGLDAFSKAEMAVLRILRDRKRIARRTLQQIVSKKGINGRIFGDVLRSLQANGHIDEFEETTTSGQTSKFVAYVPGNTQHLVATVSSGKVLGVPANNHAEAL